MKHGLLARFAPRPRGETLCTGSARVAGLVLLAVTIGCASPNPVVENPPNLEDEANRIAAAEEEIETILVALVEYAISNNGLYPDRLDVLLVLDDNGDAYLSEKDVLIDPWSNPYQYEAPGESMSELQVRSWGADGAPGGEGVNADIVAPRNR